VTRIGAAISGLGLEAAAKPFPKALQPLAKIVYRCFRKSPGTAGVFFLRISAFLTKKIIMIA
jgi:hypothetical protein